MYAVPRTNKFQLSIGNVNYKVNISERAYGLYDVKVNDETFRISIADMLLPSPNTATSVPSPKIAGVSATSGATVTGVPEAVTSVGSTIKAAMPGTVMTIKVKAGDAVKVGDVLLTLETMKMENQIKSNKAGTVREIKVQPGNFVNVGDSLISIE
jgi:biotin carboxyl carrier protein